MLENTKKILQIQTVECLPEIKKLLLYFKKLKKLNVLTLIMNNSKINFDL
jgi:hypothetical protein